MTGGREEIKEEEERKRGRKVDGRKTRPYRRQH